MKALLLTILGAGRRPKSFGANLKNFTLKNTESIVKDAQKVNAKKRQALK
jgi:hypothetical protein